MADGAEAPLFRVTLGARKVGKAWRYDRGDQCAAFYLRVIISLPRSPLKLQGKTRKRNCAVDINRLTQTPWATYSWKDMEMPEHNNHPLDRNNHHLLKFLQAAGNDLQREYLDIQQWVKVDPGTAGDQGEENWATILREWLPGYYHIVTKGKILTHDGYLSPQMDVLVLRPCYPRALLNKKLYLAGGVAAAFECKLTLRQGHIHKAMTTAAELRRHLPVRAGSPYRELQSPLLYGILAHSAAWSSKRQDLYLSISDNLRDQDHRYINHPREMIDVITIADVASWSAAKFPYFILPEADSLNATTSLGHKIRPVQTSHICYSNLLQSPEAGFSPIGAGLAAIIRKLAWEDPTGRDIADYFRDVHITALGRGWELRAWDLDVYSEQTVQQLLQGRRLGNGRTWEEWSFLLD